MKNIVTTDPQAKFWLGRLVVTANAETELEHEDIHNSINRHLSGDWGDLCAEDKEANEIALQYGGRLFSAYHDRKPTCCLICGSMSKSVKPNTFQRNVCW